MLAEFWPCFTSRNPRSITGTSRSPETGLLLNEEQEMSRLQLCYSSSVKLGPAIGNLESRRTCPRASITPSITGYLVPGRQWQLTTDVILVSIDCRGSTWHCSVDLETSGKGPQMKLRLSVGG